MADLGTETIARALRALGAALGAGPPVEMLIVGGAAGLITGQLPAALTTADVDVLLVVPPDQAEDVMAAGERVGHELRLPPAWLSEDVRLFAEALPDDWRARRVEVGRFGRLTVLAVGRLDLIAMKFYAGRPADREHLSHLRPTAAELAAVREYLAAIRGRAEPAKVDRAGMLVDAWEAMR